MAARVRLFRRRGLDAVGAEVTALQMLARDQDRDDRRLCIECESLQQTGDCFKAKKYSAEPMAPVRFPITTVRQRCAGFTWQKP